MGDPIDARHEHQHEHPDRGGLERLGRRLLRQVQDDDVPGLAAEIAYRFLFAVFPFGLFVAALGSFVAGWLDVADPAAQIVAGLGDNLPPSIASSLQPELEQLLDTARPGLLSIAALGALWTATGGTNAIVKGIHRAYDVDELRPFLLRYALALVLTLVAATGIVVSFVTIVGGARLSEEVARTVGVAGGAEIAIQILRWPVVFAVLTLAVGVLYRYAPSLVVPWRWILVGAAIFTLGWLGATAALGWYIGNVADYGATYGSLGAVIVLMLWFYATAVLLLIGAEVTAILARERSPDAIQPRGEELRALAAVDRAETEAKAAVAAVTDPDGA